MKNCKIKPRLSFSEDEIQLLISSLDCYNDHLRPFVLSLQDEKLKERYCYYGQDALRLRYRLWEFNKKHFGLFSFFKGFINEQ